MAKTFCPQCQSLVCKIIDNRKTSNWKQAHIRLSPGMELLERVQDVPHIRCRCGLLIIVLKAGE